MKILVTGGHGFIGHHLVKALLDLGNDVKVVDNHDTYGTMPQEELDKLINARLEYIGDHEYEIADIATYEIKEEFDFIYHLAGYPRQYETSLNPERAWYVAKHGLENVLAAPSVRLQRIVYISTSMVYGDFNNGVKEDAILYPKSDYGKFRQLSEIKIRRWSSMSKIPYTIVRPSAVYGPRDTDKRIVGKFLYNAMNNLPLEIKGPTEVLDFTYVDDLVSGLVLCLRKDAENETFNITRSDKQQKTIEKLSLIVQDVVDNNVAIKYLERDLNFPKRGNLSIEKATNLLGYKPSINLKKGIKRTYKWTKEFLSE